MRHLVEMSGEIAVYAYGDTSNFKLKEVLSDLVRKDVAEFSNKFSHFQYGTLEILINAALNNYSMLKLRFFNQHPHFYNVTSPISIMQLIRTLDHIYYRRIAPK